MPINDKSHRADMSSSARTRPPLPLLPAAAAACRLPPTGRPPHLFSAAMFESYVVYYLNQYLGRYVDGIDQKSLRCGGRAP